MTSCCLLVFALIRSKTPSASRQKFSQSISNKLDFRTLCDDSYFSIFTKSLSYQASSLSTAMTSFIVTNRCDSVAFLLLFINAFFRRCTPLLGFKRFGLFRPYFLRICSTISNGRAPSRWCRRSPSAEPSLLQTKRGLVEGP